MKHADAKHNLAKTQGDGAPDRLLTATEATIAADGVMGEQAVAFKIVGRKHQLSQAAIAALANLLSQLVDNLAKEGTCRREESTPASELLNDTSPLVTRPSEGIGG